MALNTLKLVPLPMTLYTGVCVGNITLDVGKYIYVNAEEKDGGKVSRCSSAFLNRVWERVVFDVVATSGGALGGASFFLFAPFFVYIIKHDEISGDATTTRTITKNSPT